jgi:hypothetical protein
LPSPLYIRKLVRLNSAIQHQRMFGRRCAHPSSLHCHYRNFRLLRGLRRQSHTPSDALDISWSVIDSLEVELSHTIADRNFKACFPRCPLVALTRDVPMRNLSQSMVRPPGAT